jgi:tight adherence protein B
MTLILIVGGALVFILLIVGIVISANAERNLVEERLGRYLQEETSLKDENAEDTSMITEWLNRRVEKTSYGDKIKRDLARADLKLKVSEYIALIVIVTISMGGFTWLLGGRDKISLLIGLVIGFFLPGFYVKRQQKKRLQKFNDQLPDMINLMVNGLRAGYSTMQAMEAVSKELPPPISDEFRRVVQEMQLGIPMERALDNLLRRIPSADLDFMITAINVQREVGGNLSEILDTISYTIRERIRIKGEIRVLTAQVMTSAKILSAVPILLGIFLWFFNREYMEGLFDNGPTCGFGALGAALLLIILGYVVMSKIADIEV